MANVFRVIQKGKKTMMKYRLRSSSKFKVNIIGGRTWDAEIQYHSAKDNREISLT